MSPVSAAKLTAEAGVAEIPMLIGGEWRTAAESYEVRDPYRNTVVAKAPRSALTDLDDALDAAVKAKAKAAATPAFERAALVRRAAKVLVERAAAVTGRYSRAGADLCRRRHSGRCAQRPVRRHRRSGAGERPARRFHHLYRFSAGRGANQGGVGLAPGRARIRRQRRHHRPPGCRYRRSGAGLRPQLDAARRAKLHFGADCLCAPQRL